MKTLSEWYTWLCEKYACPEDEFIDELRAWLKEWLKEFHDEEKYNHELAGTADWIEHVLSGEDLG